MKRAVLFTVIWALSIPLLVQHASADEGYYKQRPARQHRIPRRPVVEIETWDTQVCRPGWWQTVRDGRAFPQWRMVCTRY